MTGSRSRRCSSSSRCWVSVLVAQYQKAARYFGGSTRSRRGRTRAAQHLGPALDVAMLAAGLARPWLILKRRTRNGVMLLHAALLLLGFYGKAASAPWASRNVTASLVDPYMISSGDALLSAAGGHVALRTLFCAALSVGAVRTWSRQAGQGAGTLDRALRWLPYVYLGLRSCSPVGAACSPCGWEVNIGAIVICEWDPFISLFRSRARSTCCNWRRLHRGGMFVGRLLCAGSARMAASSPALARGVKNVSVSRTRGGLRCAPMLPVRAIRSPG